MRDESADPCEEECGEEESIDNEDVVAGALDPLHKEDDCGECYGEGEGCEEEYLIWGCIDLFVLGPEDGAGAEDSGDGEEE